MRGSELNFVDWQCSNFYRIQSTILKSTEDDTLVIPLFKTHPCNSRTPCNFHSKQTNKQRSWSFKNFFDDMILLKALNQQRHSNHFKMRDCLHFLKCVDIDTVLTILKGWNIQIFVFWCWLDWLVRLEYRGQLGADWKCSRNRDQPLLHFGSLTREACLYRP